eukprot:gene5675-6371_t
MSLQDGNIQIDIREDEDDMEEIKSCFSLFDKRGDMKVDHDKVIDVLRSLGLNPLTEDVTKCLEQSNLFNKRVDFETFFVIFKEIYKRPAVGSYADMVEGLKTLDRDQTGMISAAELRQLLMHVADKMTEEQVMQIISNHEDDHASVAYEEMIKTVLSG